GGSMKHQVVVEPARRAQSSRLDSLEHDIVRHVDQNHGIDVIALEEELGLPPIPREAVEHESEVPIMLIKSATDDLFDDLVWHQLPLAHDSHDSRSEFRVYLKIPPENVAHGDVDEIAGVLEQLGLRAFPAALDAHDDVL